MRLEQLSEEIDRLRAALQDTQTVHAKDGCQLCKLGLTDDRNTIEYDVKDYRLIPIKTLISATMMIERHHDTQRAVCACSMGNPDEHCHTWYLIQRLMDLR